jgi:AcrR family transcriptional regulator
VGVVDDKRRQILDQALALVDERGLAAMSMRAVAERVGLTSMALYPYVGGKDALLDGLVDLLHLELGTAVGGDPADHDWRHRLCALGRAVRSLARAHPSAFPLLLNRSAAGPAASWLAAALQGILADAGVPSPDVPRTARLICAFLLGYTTGEVTGGLPGSSGEMIEGAAEFDADLEDLVRMVENSATPASDSGEVRSGDGSGTPSRPGRSG